MTAPRNMLITLSNPAEGTETEYLSWYRDEHLSEVVALEGFASATLYVLDDAQVPGFPECPQRYMCLYELDGDPVQALAALQDALASGEMVLPTVIDQHSIRPWNFARIADTVTAPSAELEPSPAEEGR